MSSITVASHAWSTRALAWTMATRGSSPRTKRATSLRRASRGVGAAEAVSYSTTTRPRTFSGSETPASDAVRQSTRTHTWMASGRAARMRRVHTASCHDSRAET